MLHIILCYTTQGWIKRTNHQRKLQQLQAEEEERERQQLQAEEEERERGGEEEGEVGTVERESVCELDEQLQEEREREVRQS